MFYGDAKVGVDSLLGKIACARVSGEQTDRVLDPFAECLHQARAIEAVDGAIVRATADGHGVDLEPAIDDVSSRLLPNMRLLNREAVPP